MSRHGRLFNPRSLRRVANAVEWEDELEWYKDGTSNQEMYMAAMSILWERWIRNWGLVELQVLASAGGSDWWSAFKDCLSMVPGRIAQIRGFYEGLWWGANPTWNGPVPKGVSLANRAVIDDSPETRMLSYFRNWLNQCRAYLD